MAPKIVNCCINVIRWTPVVFITAIIVWSYYAYVVQMCILTIDNRVETVLYLIVYHPLILVFLWAYWKTIFTDPGIVPKEFYLSAQDVQRFNTTEQEDVQRGILERHGRNLPVQCRTNSGAFRYCEKCKCVKPDRAHHCSVCGRCVLKMDHHCPWVNNCVNFTNYKFFVLFLGYGLVYCIYIAATSAQYFVRFWTQTENKNLSNLHIVFLFFAGIMFAISLISLFGYHLFLTSANRSTLESFRTPIFSSGPDKEGFSLGIRCNFQEVFGDSKIKGFLPLFSSRGDGVSYPTPISLREVNNYHSTRNTDQSAATISETVEANTNNENNVSQSDNIQQSFGDGVNFPVRTIDEDNDRLLGDRQRWMEEGDSADAHGYQNDGVSTHL